MVAAYGCVKFYSQVVFPFNSNNILKFFGMVVVSALTLALGALQKIIHVNNLHWRNDDDFTGGSVLLSQSLTNWKNRNIKNVERLFFRVVWDNTPYYTTRF